MRLNAAFSIRRVGLAISAFFVVCGAAGLWLCGRPDNHALLYWLRNDIENVFGLGLIALFAIFASYPKALWARLGLSLFTALLLLAYCLPHI